MFSFPSIFTMFFFTSNFPSTSSLPSFLPSLLVSALRSLSLLFFHEIRFYCDFPLLPSSLLLSLFPSSLPLSLPSSLPPSLSPSFLSPSFLPLYLTEATEPNKKRKITENLLKLTATLKTILCSLNFSRVISLLIKDNYFHTNATKWLKTLITMKKKKDIN